MISWARFKKTRGIAGGIVIPKFKEAAKDYQNELLEKEASKIEGCGTYVKVIQCGQCGDQYFRNFSKCKSKYCPSCAAIKGSIWCAKLYPRIQQWLSEGKYVCFGTFTIPAQDDLQTALDTIYGAWKFMTNKQSATEWKKRFAGGVKSVEVKIGKFSGKWHIHIHCLLFRAKFGRDHNFLREAWIKAVQHFLGDVQVNMPRIESIKQKTTTNKEKDRILAAICETVKYMTKINTDMDPSQLIDAFIKLKGRRQISCWGVLNGLTKKVEKEMDDDSENKIESFKCATCGCTFAEWLDIWDRNGKNWQETEMAGDYKTVVTFAPADERLNKEDETNEDYKQQTIEEEEE